MVWQSDCPKSDSLNLMLRPPIIVVLGHVDHGKTTLLDALRQTSLAAAEPGGITQTIGAFKVGNLTFIDTPGHEAFSKMRSRGANVADIALLVIAADDGVKPQTLESLSIIKEAKIPLIVVISKIDLDNSNTQNVKTELAKHDCPVEGFGGDVPVVEISAKTGQNLPELLEMISLVWELQESPGRRAGREVPDRPFPLEAPIIDSRLDPHSGPITSVIIRQGNLRLGDQIAAADSSGKVKALINDRGQRVNQALPGDPVQILGLKSVPPVGSILSSPVISSRFSVVGSKSAGFQSIGQEPANRKLTNQNLATENGKPITGNVILKADSAATLETLENVIVSLPEPKYAVISAGVGDVAESDILLAASSKSNIIGFRIKVSKKRLDLAKNEGVLIISDFIIYRLLEKLTDLQKPPEEKLPPETGRAKVVKVFAVNGTEIAGCIVQSGKFSVGDIAVIIKDNIRLGPAKIKQLKFRAEDIKEAKAGSQCGVLLEPQTPDQKLKLSEGQDIIAYQS